jgi:hypothetical protein
MTDTDPRPQADKFRDLARELECDEDEDAFKAKLRQVAQPVMACGLCRLG